MAHQANSLLGLAAASLSRDRATRRRTVGLLPSRGEITLIRLTEIGTAVDPRGHSCRARRHRVACAMGVDDAGLADSPRLRPRPRPPRRGARISAPSRRRSSSPAIAPARAVTKGRRDWQRIAARVRSPASCASTTPTAARARRRWPPIWWACRAPGPTPSNNRRVRRRAPTMRRSRASRRLRFHLLQRRPEKPASRPSPLRRPQRARSAAAKPLRRHNKLPHRPRHRSRWRRRLRRSRRNRSGIFSTRTGGSGLFFLVLRALPRRLPARPRP